MEHTYLMKTAHWRVEGVYHADMETTVPMTGELDIIRKGSTWTLTSVLNAAAAEPVRMENRCQIQTTANTMELAWTGENPALGKMEGTFVVLPGIITSSYTVAESAWSGSEMLMQVDETTYKMQGVLNRDGEPETWWEGLLHCDDAC